MSREPEVAARQRHGWRPESHEHDDATAPVRKSGATPRQEDDRFRPSSKTLSRLRNMLIVVQIAVTIVLLTGSVALGRAFVALMSVPYGYDFAPVATLSVSLAGTRHESGDRARASYDEVFRRVERIPGVASVSATESLPLALEGVSAGTFSVAGSGRPTQAPILQVSPGYFNTVGAALLAGREFTPRIWPDRSGSPSSLNPSRSALATLPLLPASPSRQPPGRPGQSSAWSEG